MQTHNLDGLDFDGEYPGVKSTPCVLSSTLRSLTLTIQAPDIPGIPAGGPNDGANYLEFLQMVKAILPLGKGLSIAAPASYW
jgi:chitinase